MSVGKKSLRAARSMITCGQVISEINFIGFVRGAMAALVLFEIRFTLR